MFGWHREDLDLFSINYLHSGKPKLWYGVPPNEAEKFDKLAKTLFPGAYQECPEFLRHKTYFIYPPVIRQQGINVAR